MTPPPPPLPQRDRNAITCPACTNRIGTIPSNLRTFADRIDHVQSTTDAHTDLCLPSQRVLRVLRDTSPDNR